jgi:Holliday junction resolvase
MTEDKLKICISLRNEIRKKEEIIEQLKQFSNEHKARNIIAIKMGKINYETLILDNSENEKLIFRIRDMLLTYHKESLIELQKEFNDT